MYSQVIINNKHSYIIGSVVYSQVIINNKHTYIIIGSGYYK